MTLLIMTVNAALTQTPAPTKLPTISLELRTKFFKAQARLLQAQARQRQLQQELDQFKLLVEKSVSVYQDVIQTLLKVCGDGANVVSATETNGAVEEGDPVCAAKPPAPEAKK